MKELDFLEIISKTLSVNSYLGDDCAFLDDLDIFVTHDTLVENVHFSLHTISPYLLGRKSVAVNLSDLAAALCIPKYISVSLSLPSDIENSFVEEFYKGVNDICSEYKVKVIGGDITGAESVVVSICAIGKKTSLFLSSRKYAKKGDIVVISGKHGSSSAGLFALSNFLYAPQVLINSHLNPTPKVFESIQIASLIDSNIASMDSSDGLVDALYKLALNSKHSIEIDINKIPIDPEIIDFSNQNNLNYKDFIKWGGEDYSLIYCLPEEVYEKLNRDTFIAVGEVLNKDNNPVVIINDRSLKETVTKKVFNEKSFNHFKGIL